MDLSVEGLKKGELVLEKQSRHPRGT